METQTVTFEETDIGIEAMLGGSHIASVEEISGRYLVVWGPMFARSRRFRSIEGAKDWIANNAQELKEDVV